MNTIHKERLKTRLQMGQTHDENLATTLLEDSIALHSPLCSQVRKTLNHTTGSLCQSVKATRDLCNVIIEAQGMIHIVMVAYKCKQLLGCQHSVEPSGLRKCCEIACGGVGSYGHALFLPCIRLSLVRYLHRILQDEHYSCTSARGRGRFGGLTYRTSLYFPFAKHAPLDLVALTIWIPSTYRRDRYVLPKPTSLMDILCRSTT